MMKRVIGILLAILICSASVMSVYAADIGFYWVNTQSVSLELTFSNGTATAKSTIIGKSDTASISATYSLQEKSGSNWTTVHTWKSVSVTGRTLSFSDTAAVSAGKTYRLCVTATIKNNAGTSETVTDYHEKAY